MKFIEDGKKAKRDKNRGINTILLIVAVILILTGIICLLIDPIRSWRRQQITSDALEVIESGITEGSKLTMEEDTVITYVVPRDGNEVAGESYDYYGEDEEDILALKRQVEDNEKNLPKKVVLSCAGILKIDKIDLELPVWTESSRIALRYGLGIYEDSVKPGEAGNSTILGHRNRHTNTMFYRLKEVKEGDGVVFISAEGHELLFTVDKVKIVNAKDLMDYIEGDITDSVQLTLVTCANGEQGYGEGARRLVICHMSQED
ncbi:MAG: sortase [Clostridiales bacterium]|nr:sortase [Clostridiales bacterium]MBO4579133.1 sortase [Clostridiales bacterium]